MGSFIILLSPDKGIAEGAVGLAGLRDAKAVTDLSAVANEDTVILYTHGVHSGGRPPIAENQIEFGSERLGATDAAERLIAGFGLKKGLHNLTIIVHACFSAGTVESPPPDASKLDTFAGALCSALKNLGFDGIQVIGYQGATKGGIAGMSVAVADGTDEQPSVRNTRNSKSPFDGSNFEVRYTANDSGTAEIQSQGGSVVWN